MSQHDNDRRQFIRRAAAGIGAGYVVTPNGLHAGQTFRIARAGKHVLCDLRAIEAIYESIRSGRTVELG